jgi:hypothetical protein
MNTITNIADYSKRPLTQEAWRDYLQVAQRNSVESILEFGRRVYEYYLECQHDRTQGGSVFTRNAQEWLGLSEYGVKQCKAIGERAEELVANSNKLPNAEKTIYLIATLPDETRHRLLEDGTINEKVTQRELTEIKRKLSGRPPKETVKPEGAKHWLSVVEMSGVAPNWSLTDFRSNQNNGGVRDLIEQAYGKAIPAHIVPGSHESESLLDAVRSVYLSEYPEAPITKTIVEPVTEVTIEQLITQLTKLIPDVVLTEIQPQNGLPSFTYAGLSQNRGRIKGLLDAMDKKNQKDSLKVLLAVLEYQNKVFEEIVKATKPKYIKALEAKLQKEIDDQKAKTAQITENSVKLPSNMMSQKEVKIIKGVLHPDRLSTLTEEKMNAAFLIFQRIYG